jgi:hypothetical protein
MKKTKKKLKKLNKKVVSKKKKVTMRKYKKKRPPFVQVDMSTMTPQDGSTYLPVTFRHIHG